MPFKIRPTLIVLGGGFLFCLDQTLKWLSLNTWGSRHLLNEYLGWRPFINKDAAFGAPLPNIFVIILAVLILSLIVCLLFRALEGAGGAPLVLAYSFVFFGGLSNLLDRLITGATTDYFLVFTAIINLADIMIAAGLITLLVAYKKHLHYNNF